MAITVRDNPEHEQYELFEDDERIGLSIYKLHDGVISFTHTEVDPAYGGRGLGKQLVVAELDDARRRGLSVLPFCPYVRKVIADDPDTYLSLVPEAERSRFDLPTTD